MLCLLGAQGVGVGVQCVTAGLYPPNGDNDKLDVYSLPAQAEPLYPNTVPCGKLAHVFMKGRRRFTTEPNPELDSLRAALAPEFSDTEGSHSKAAAGSDQASRVNFIRLKDVITAKLSDGQELPPGIAPHADAVERAATAQVCSH